MNYRTLGRTGLKVSEIGYGAWGIGGKQWLGGRDEESLAALRRSIELGLNFIDTALAYGDGHSEQLVGQVVRESPQTVYVATKIPPKNGIWPAQPGVPIREVFPYDYCIRSTENSLRNLQRETIDLQQLHVWNPDFTLSDEWRRAAEDLKRSGKVRYFGISIGEHVPDTALDAIATGLIDAVQVIYNVFDQTPEERLFPATLQHNVGVLARVPLDEGGLTGKLRAGTTFPPGDFREFYFRGDRKKQVEDRVGLLEAELASIQYIEPLAETALRFCLSHPAVSTVIPGMRSVRNAEANCSVSDRGGLNPDVLSHLKRHAWYRNFYN